MRVTLKRKAGSPLARGASWFALTVSLGVHAGVLLALPGFVPLNDVHSPELQLRLEQGRAPVVLVSTDLQPPTSIASSTSLPPRRTPADSTPTPAQPPVDTAVNMEQVAAPAGDLVVAEPAIPELELLASGLFKARATAGDGQALAVGDSAAALLPSIIGSASAAATAEPPPVDEPAAPAPAIDTQALLSDYAAAVKRMVLAQKYYPGIAERKGEEGAVSVGFAINADGSLAEVRIKSGSGSSELDDAAMRAVRNAAPFAAIPPELERASLSLSITLKYTLR